MPTWETMKLRSEAKPRLSKLDEDGIRQLCREATRRSRLHKQLQHRFEELQILNDNLIRKESARKKNLMNIKLSYSNDAIKQRLEEVQNIKDNLLRENSARTKNLLNICEDCMKLSPSNDVSEEEITSDESLSQGSDRSQLSTDVTGQS